MGVHLLPAAADELRALPPAERRAMLNALEKLQVLGPQLPYSHSSQVKIGITGTSTTRRTVAMAGVVSPGLAAAGDSGHRAGGSAG